MNIQLLLAANPSQGSGTSTSQTTGAQSVSNGLFRQAMLQANEGQPRLPQALSASSAPNSQATTDLKEFAALLDSLGIELDQEGLAALFAQLQNTEQPSAEQLAMLPGVLDDTTDVSLSALDEIASRLSLVAAFSDSPAQSSASTTDTLSIADIAEQLAISHQDAAALVTAYQQLTANTDTTGSRQRVDTLNQQIAALLSHTPAQSPTEGKPATPGMLTVPSVQDAYTTSEKTLYQQIDFASQLSLSPQDTAPLAALYPQSNVSTESIHIEAPYQRLTSLFSANAPSDNQTAHLSILTVPILQIDTPNLRLSSEATELIKISNSAKNPITLQSNLISSESLLSKQDHLIAQLSMISGNTDFKGKLDFPVAYTLSIADIAEQLALSHQDAAALVTAYQQLTANTDTAGSRQRFDTLNQQIAALLSHTPAQSPTEGKPATPGTLTAPTLPTPPPHQGISSEAIASALAVSSGASEGTARFGSAGELALSLPGTANSANPASTPIAASSSTPLPPSIGTPVSHPAWPSQLGQQLVQFAQRGGEQHIQMKLHPAELGPLSISLKMTEHGAQAHFLSAHAQVRQVVEQAIPQLREALAEQGISLGETSVGEQNASNEQTFAQQSGGGASASGDGSSVEGDMGAPTSESTPVTLDGRVDLYA